MHSKWLRGAGVSAHNPAMVNNIGIELDKFLSVFMSLMVDTTSTAEGNHFVA